MVIYNYNKWLIGNENERFYWCLNSVIFGLCGDFGFRKCCVYSLSLVYWWDFWCGFVVGSMVGISDENE